MTINVFTASGNIGKDCEVRFTKNGKAIATFSLPVKSGWGDNEKTSWVTCKMFGAKAEGQLPQYLTRGTKVTVTGEFVLEEWDSQNGEKNKMAVVLIRDIDFGGSKSDNEQSVVSQNQQNMSNNGASRSNTATNMSPPQTDDSFDDHIPF